MVYVVIPSSKIELGFPHDLLAAEYMKDTTYGGTYASIYDLICYHVKEFSRTKKINIFFIRDG